MDKTVKNRTTPKQRTRAIINFDKDAYKKASSTKDSATVFEAEGSQLSDILQKISYSSLPKSDLNNWIGVLNKLDGILENMIEKYNLKEVQVVDFSKEDKELILSVLTLTRTLFDKCTNRNLYCSYERLNELLNTNDIDVLEMVLVVIMRPAQRVNAQRSVRMNFLISQDRIRSLTAKWNHAPYYPNWLELMKPTARINEESKILTFRFYRNNSAANDSDKKEKLESAHENNEDSSAEGESLAQIVRIHINDPYSKGSTATEIYLNLVKEYDIPLNDRRVFFHRIQIVTSITNPERRAKMLSIRQLSIAIYCYMVSENSANKTILYYDSSLITDLVSLLTPDAGIPLNVQTSSLHALDAISHYNGKINDVLNAIGVSANHGVLITLIKRVASLEDKDDSRFMALVDTLFAFLGFIFTSQSGGNMLISAGILPILVKFLTSEMESAPRRLVYKGIQLMDNAIYGFPSAFTSFQSVNGLTLLVNRIEEQVEWCINSFKDETASDFNLSDNIVKVEGMILLKGLIKFVLHMMQTSSTGVGLRNLIDTSLPNSLRKIFEAPGIFTPTVYGQAINIMTTIIHNEPTSLSVLQEQQLPQTFLAAIVDQIPNASDTLYPIVNSFGAICLNSQGLTDFTNSSVINKFFELFLLPKYIDILEEPEAVNSLGNSLDELIRHNPSLKKPAIDAIFHVIYTLVDYGNDKFDVWEALIAPYIEKDLHESLHLHLIEAIEKVSDNPDYGSVQKEKTPTLYLLRLIDVFCQFLNSFFNTSFVHFNAFNGSGGSDLLLEFYSMKAAPYDFPSTPAANSLSRIFRCSSEEYLKNVVKVIMRRIFSALDRSSSWLNCETYEGFMVQLLKSNKPEKESDLLEIFAQLNELNGLTGLLNELCDPLLYNQSNLVSSLTEAFLKCEDQTFIPRLGRLLSVVQWEMLQLRQAKLVTLNDSSAGTGQDLYKYESTFVKNIHHPFDLISSNIIATFKDFSKLMMARRTMTSNQKKNAKAIALNMSSTFEAYITFNRIEQQVNNCTIKYYTTAFGFLNAISVDKRHVQYIHVFMVMALEKYGVFDKALEVMEKMLDFSVALKSDITFEPGRVADGDFFNETMSLDDFFTIAFPSFECLCNHKSYESIYLANFSPKQDEPNYENMAQPNDYIKKVRFLFSNFLSRFWECDKQLVFSDSHVASAINTSTMLIKNNYLQLSETRARTIHPALANFLSIRRPTVTVNQERLDQMVEMGYPRGGSETALLHNQNNISRAIDYLSEHPELYVINSNENNNQEGSDHEEGGNTNEDTNDANLVVENAEAGDGANDNDDNENEVANEDDEVIEDEEVDLDNDGTEDNNEDDLSENDDEVEEEGSDAMEEISEENMPSSFRFYKEDLSTIYTEQQLIEKHQQFSKIVEAHFFDLISCSPVIKTGLRDLVIEMLEGERQADIQQHLEKNIKESFKMFTEGSYDQLTNYLEFIVLILSQTSAIKHISSILLDIFEDLFKVIEKVIEDDSDDLNPCIKVVLATLNLLLILSTEIVPEHIATNFTALSDIEIQVRFPQIIEHFSADHQKRLTLLCVKLIGSNYAKVDDTFRILVKTLIILTRYKENVAVLCEADGPETLLSSLKAHPTNLKQHRYIQHLLTNLIESRDVLLFAMRQQISHKFNKGGMPYDLKTLVKQSSHLIFRNPDVFLDAMLLEIKVTSYDEGSSLPRIGARKKSDPIPEHLVEDDQREGVPPLDDIGLKVLSLLINEVLNFNKSENTVVDETSNKEYALTYRCFILNALSEFFHFHPSCRFSFLGRTKNKGESVEQLGVVLPSRSHFINTLLDSYLPYNSLEQEAFKVDTLKGAQSSYALFTLSSLVVGHADLYLESIGIDLAPTRRYVLELIHSYFSDTLNLSSSLTKYCKLVALCDLCSHLLFTKPVGTLFYPKPDENSNTSTAILLFKIKFPHLLITLMDFLDTEAPGMIRVLNSALRPLDTLSKIAIRVGQEIKADESTVADIPQSEDDESASEAEAAEDFVRGSYISVLTEPADQHQDEYFSEEEEGEDPGFSSESVEEYDEFDIGGDDSDSNESGSGYESSGMESDIDVEEVVEDSDENEDDEGSVHIETVFEDDQYEGEDMEDEADGVNALLEEMNELSATPEDSEDNDEEQLEEIIPITIEHAFRDGTEEMFVHEDDRQLPTGRPTHEAVANQISHLRNTFGVIRANRNRVNVPNAELHLAGEGNADQFSTHRRRMLMDFAGHPMVHAEVGPNLANLNDIFPTMDRGNHQQHQTHPLRMAASRILVQLMSQHSQVLGADRETAPFEIFGNSNRDTIMSASFPHVTSTLDDSSSEDAETSPISCVRSFRSLTTPDRWVHMVDAAFGFANQGMYTKIIFKLVKILIEVHRIDATSPQVDNLELPERDSAATAELSDAPIAALNPHTPILNTGEFGSTNIRSNVGSATTNLARSSRVEPAVRETIMINGDLVDITNSGIDRTFLEALPDDLRQEVLLQHFSGNSASIDIPESTTIGEEFLNAVPDEIREEVLRSEQTILQNSQVRNGEAQEETSEAQPSQAPNPSGSGLSENVTTAAIEPEGTLVNQEAQSLVEPPATVQPITRDSGDRLTGLTLRRIIGTGITNDHETNTQTNKEALQITDREELATLVKLLFIPHAHNRSFVMKVLVNLSSNPKTCCDLISMLLLLVQDDVSDIESLDKLFSSMSIKSRRNHQIKNNKVQFRETVPNLITLKCLEMMNQLIALNSASVKYFLTDLEGFHSKKPTKRPRGKEKDIHSKYPLNTLISLLERPKYFEDVSLMDNVMKLLSTTTKQLASQLKHSQTTEGSTTTVIPVDTNEEMQTEEAPENIGSVEAPETSNSKAVRHPPITDNNYKSIINILTSEKCSTKTFQHTLVTIQQLSITPRAETVFVSELIERSKQLSDSILQDVTQAYTLLGQNAKDDVQSMILTKFSQPSSDQTKFLRLLKTLDFMHIRKENTYRKLKKLGLKHAAKLARDKGAPLFYRDLHDLDLWNHLSNLLAEIQDHSDLLSIASVLLPLIEAFMVICKHSSDNVTKSSSVDLKREENFESTLFFQFTERHRKLLNTIIRDNPALMNGTFALLIKNHKVLDFDNKRNYFHQELHKRNSDRDYSSTLQVNVRRNTVFEDSFRQFQGRNGDEIKYAKLNIKFADEEGVDAGGVTREWFSVLSRQMFDPNNALFLGSAADRVTYQPNRLSSINPDHLQFFKFVGRVIGKAIYDSNVLDAYFTRAFYKHILGRPVDLKDLEATDPTYYNSLNWILNNDITNVMELTFSVEIDDFGVNTVHDLIPGGRDIAVTEINKHEYVHLVVQQKLYTAIKEQTDSFLKGFHEIIPEKLIGIFDEQELELLISGLPDIDIDDWRNNTSYNGFTSTAPQVTWFWRVVRTMDPEHRAKLLQFVTGTSKVPLEGFASLQGSTGIQKFQIHKDYSSTKRLPTSHTCFNQLDLPVYESYEELRKQILLAIQEGATGFGFS